MHRYWALIFVALFALPIMAQQATINAPAARSAETKILVTEMRFSRDCVCAAVIVEYQDATSAATRQQRFDIPADPANPSTELQTFLAAIETTRATETGIASRKMNFRVLGYLFDSGRLSGVTLVP